VAPGDDIIIDDEALDVLNEGDDVSINDIVGVPTTVYCRASKPLPKIGHHLGSSSF
jgi:hypothetical protein